MQWGGGSKRHAARGVWHCSTGALWLVVGRVVAIGHVYMSVLLAWAHFDACCVHRRW